MDVKVNRIIVLIALPLITTLDLISSSQVLHAAFRQGRPTSASSVKPVRTREEVPFLVRFQSEDDSRLIYNGILITETAALGHGSMNAMRSLIPRPPKRVPSFQAILGDLDPSRDDENGEVHIRRLTFSTNHYAFDDVEKAYLVIFPRKIERTSKIQPIRMAYITDSVTADYKEFPVTVYGWGSANNRPLKFTTAMVTDSRCSFGDDVTSEQEFCVEDQSAEANGVRTARQQQNFFETGAAVTVKAGTETFLLGMCNREVAANLRLSNDFSTDSNSTEDTPNILRVHSWTRFQPKARNHDQLTRLSSSGSSTRIAASMCDPGNAGLQGLAPAGSSDQEGSEASSGSGNGWFGKISRFFEEIVSFLQTMFSFPS